MLFRQVMLTIVRALGGFALATRLTARGLQIICYHGISLRDEHCFQPNLFMQEDTFRERITYLKRSDFQVLSLYEALSRLDQETLPPRALVITFDDGWLGIGTKAVPLLRKYGFPSTLYVTTKDVLSQTPVFDVALRYLLWGKKGEAIDLRFMGSDHPETILLSSPGEIEHAACRISDISKNWDDNNRQVLLLKIAEILSVEWNSDENNTLFRLMTMEQLAQLPSTGMDLQLHTHRHRLPIDDQEDVENEISNNREVLKRIVSGPLEHFCYPSGEFHPSQFPWLKKLGIESATTCLSGFNYPNTERFALRRFLDGEHITQVEFEAELSGFLELMRKLRRALPGRQNN
jgi:peptidoglycan/xylan/chitin deacetylase (PgdA/CDA1 family)